MPRHVASFQAHGCNVRSLRRMERTFGGSDSPRGSPPMPFDVTGLGSNSRTGRFGACTVVVVKSTWRRLDDMSRILTWTILHRVARKYGYATCKEIEPHQCWKAPGLKM